LRNLLLTEDLAHALLGALLAVCRADGDATTAEFRALRHIGDELGFRYDNEWLLFFSHVTPRSLAEAVRDAAAQPFRSQAVSARQAIAQEFVIAAVKLAKVDGHLNTDEARSICGFARELGISPSYIEHLDKVLDDHEAAAEYWG
jgi:tellurite resistance protein